MSTDFAPSPYQEAIFDFVRRGTGHAMIEVAAGSSQSMTLLKALEMLPPKTSVTFVAFNWKIVRHVRALATKHVKVCTLHSLGYEAVRQAYGNTALLVDRKTAPIVIALRPNGPRGLGQSQNGEIPAR